MAEVQLTPLCKFPVVSRRTPRAVYVPRVLIVAVLALVIVTASITAKAAVTCHCVDFYSERLLYEFTCPYRCPQNGGACNTCTPPPPPTPTATTTETYVGCWSRTTCGQCVPGDPTSSTKSECMWVLPASDQGGSGGLTNYQPGDFFYYALKVRGPYNTWKCTDSQITAYTAGSLCCKNAWNDPNVEYMGYQCRPGAFMKATTTAAKPATTWAPLAPLKDSAFAKCGSDWTAKLKPGMNAHDSCLACVPAGVSSCAYCSQGGRETCISMTGSIYPDGWTEKCTPFIFDVSKCPPSPVSPPGPGAVPPGPPVSPPGVPPGPPVSPPGPGEVPPAVPVPPPGPAPTPAPLPTAYLASVQKATFSSSAFAFALATELGVTPADVSLAVACPSATSSTPGQPPAPPAQFSDLPPCNDFTYAVTISLTGPSAATAAAKMQTLQGNSLKLSSLGIVTVAAAPSGPPPATPSSSNTIFIILGVVGGVIVAGGVVGGCIFYFVSQSRNKKEQRMQHMTGSLIPMAPRWVRDSLVFP